MKSVFKCAIVIPVFNEAENLPNLIKSIRKISKRFTEFDFDIILVNDGSLDESWQIIKSYIYEPGSNIIGINFSRNFGKESAITAGMREAGDYNLVFTMDADLQHPPEMIPKMLKQWQRGAEMVICIRESREGETVFRKLSSIIFYKFMRSVSTLDTTRNSTDFRLYDQKVVLALNKLQEKVRIFRGLADWVGFKKVYLNFNAPKRVSGKSTFGVNALISLATSSLVSFSLWPLKATAFLGFFVFVVGAFSLALITLDKFTIQYINAGPLAIVSVLHFSVSGIVLSAVGVIALYLSKVNAEISGRPIYIIAEKLTSKSENR